MILFLIEYLRVTRATGYPPGVAGNPDAPQPKLAQVNNTV